MAKKMDSEMEKLDGQFQEFDKQVKELSSTALNSVPVEEGEKQTKMAQKDIAKTNDVYIKPQKTVGSKEKFNETYRKEWDHAKSYVQIIAEHKEIIGETIEMWTKAFPGVPAEFWNVPTNKPIFVPRYVAEQLKRCNYMTYHMDETQTAGADGRGQYYGRMVVDKRIQRIDAYAARQERQNYFMSGTF